MLTDAHQRTVTYLRLSVTDRCNFRCVYCMPAEGLQWFPPETLLQDDEIITLLREVYLPLGISKIRLTGGEPLLRKGLPDLMQRMQALPGIQDIALSTNGLFLAPFAARLKQAGLQRVNISLDTLDPERFRSLTRGGDLQRVLRGIDAALEHNLLVKLNTVVVPGLNETDVLELASLTRSRPIHLRFIEMMPVGNKALFDERQFISLDAITQRLASQFPLEAADRLIAGNGPATIMKIQGALGTVGFITPMSRQFCHSCNRTRLTADGQIKACLMRPQELDLLGALRRGESPAEMQRMVAQSLGYKPDYHDWGSGHTLKRTMSQIGG